MSHPTQLADPPDAELLFLGTSSMMPSKSRNVSATGLRIGSHWWLFDCGEGTQHQVIRTQGKFSPGKVSRVFISHMHGDHCFGIPGFLCKIGTTREDEKDRLVQIVGPKGLRNFVRNVLSATYTKLTYTYVVHELWDSSEVEVEVEVESGDNNKSKGIREVEATQLHPCEVAGRNLLPRSDGSWDIELIAQSPAEACFKVVSCTMQHTIPCHGFVITEKSYPGKMNIPPELKQRLTCAENREFCKAKGIANPLSLLSSLKAGQNVELYDGVLTPEQGARRQGRKISIMGDTCDSRNIAEHAYASTYLVHEATNAYIAEEDVNETDLSVTVKAYSHGHSTVKTAARFARDIQAEYLLLTHFSSRYKPEDDPTMGQIAEQAREVFDKQVICAQDFMSIPLKLPKSHPTFATESDYKQAAKRAKTVAAEEGDRLRSIVDAFVKQQATVVV